MADTKKPPRPPVRGAISRPPASLKSVDPATRVAACEAGLAKATRDIAALRLSMEAVLADLEELRARVASGMARLRKLPPPLRESSHEVISVDDREVVLESSRPKKPR